VDVGAALRGWTAAGPWLALVVAVGACESEPPPKMPEPPPIEETAPQDPLAGVSLGDYADRDALGAALQKVHEVLGRDAAALRSHPDVAAQYVRALVDSAVVALGAKADTEGAKWLGGIVGAAGADAPAVLRAVGDEIARVADVVPDDATLPQARAVLSALTVLHVPDSAVDVARFDALLAGSEPLSAAARLLVLEHLAPRIEALVEAPPQRRGAVFDAPVAAWLCPSCRKVAAEGGDATRVAAAGEPGAVCPRGRKAVQAARSDELVAKLDAACRGSDYGLPESTPAHVALGTNLLPIRALALVDLALRPVPDDDPLAAQLRPLQQTWRGRTVGPLPLDVPPEALAAAVAPGPPWTAAPLDVVLVTATEVRGTLRPTVVLRQGQLVLVGADQGLAWPGKVLARLADLVAPPPKEGAAEAPDPRAQLAEALRGLRADVARAAGTLPQAHQDPAAETARWPFVVLDPSLRAPAIDAVFDALARSGAAGARLVAGVGPRAWVPVVLGSPDARAEALGLRRQQPVVVVLRKDEADVFPASGKLRATGKSVRPRPGAPKLPDGAKAWYRWERFAKATVALDGDVPAAAQRLRQTVAAVVAHSGAGPYVAVHVEGHVDAPHLVAWLDAIGQASSTEGLDWATLLPASACAEAKPPCARGVVGLRSGIAPPALKGLSTEPRKRPASEPVEVVAAQRPSAEFCNKADIKRVMAGRANAFKFCYERVLQTYPDLAGRVVVRFEIPESGKARNIRIARSDLGNEKVHQCIIKQIRKLTFEPPRGGVCAVNWPMRFTPR